MKKKMTKISIIIAIATFVLVTVSATYSNMAFALIGFGLGSGDQSTGGSQSSWQDSRCYSPHGSIINSCNSDGLSTSNNTGFSSLGQ